MSTSIARDVAVGTATALTAAMALELVRRQRATEASRPGAAPPASAVAASAAPASAVAAPAAPASAVAAPAAPGPALGNANERLLRVALELLPEPGSVLQPGNPTWDAILGGKRPDFLGGAAWRYFSVFAGEKDGQKRKGGTTCGVFATALAARAGWDVALINRATDDAWAPGSGFTPGAHIYKLLGAAKKRGWEIPFVGSPSSAIAGASIGFASADGALWADFGITPRQALQRGFAEGEGLWIPPPGYGTHSPLERADKARRVLEEHWGQEPWFRGIGISSGPSLAVCVASPGDAARMPASYMGFPIDVLGGASSEFQPLRGDYYYQDRKGATYNGKPADGGHVGIILDVGAPDASGMRILTTADGGFTNDKGEQCAVRHTRHFYPDGRIVLMPFKIEARLVSVVRPT